MLRWIVFIDVQSIHIIDNLYLSLKKPKKTPLSLAFLGKTIARKYIRPTLFTLPRKMKPLHTGRIQDLKKGGHNTLFFSDRLETPTFFSDLKIFASILQAHSRGTLRASQISDKQIKKKNYAWVISISARDWGEMRESHAQCVRVGSPAVTKMSTLYHYHIPTKMTLFSDLTIFASILQAHSRGTLRASQISDKQIKNKIRREIISISAWDWGEMRESHAQCVRVGSPAVTKMSTLYHYHIPTKMNSCSPPPPISEWKFVALYLTGMYGLCAVLMVAFFMESPFKWVQVIQCPNKKETRFISDISSLPRKHL